MCLSIVCEDLYYLRVELDAILLASLLYNLKTTERLDSSSEELVSLETYDELILSVDLTGSMRCYC